MARQMDLYVFRGPLLVPAPDPSHVKCRPTHTAIRRLLDFAYFSDVSLNSIKDANGERNEWNTRYTRVYAEDMITIYATRSTTSYSSLSALKVIY